MVGGVLFLQQFLWLKIFIFKGVLFLLSFTLLFAHPCFAQEEKLKIFVSIPAQVEFVHALTSNEDIVFSILKPGKQLENLTISDQFFLRLTQSDLFIITGTLAYEQQLIQRLKDHNPEINILDFSQGLEFIMSSQLDSFYASDQFRDMRLPEVKEEVNSYYWLDPVIIHQQLSLISQSLIQLRPDLKLKFEENEKIYQEKLDQLHLTIMNDLSDYSGSKMIIFNDTLGYFSNRYDLNQILVPYRKDNPHYNYYNNIVTFMNRHYIDVIFSQVSYHRRVAHAIAKKVDGSVIEWDPFFKGYIDNLLTLSKKLKYAFLKSYNK